MARSPYRPRILQLNGNNRKDWRPLLDWADVASLPLPDESYLLNGPPSSGDFDPEACFEIARSFSGRFDYVLGDCTGGFLWHSVFRLVGDRTPFLLIPRFNHVQGANALALLLSSRLRLPGDRIFAGSEAASRSFRHYGFACDPLYLPGVSLEIFRPLVGEKAGLRRDLGLDPHKATLLYTGRMADDKNILELLEAFAEVRKHRPAQLVLCYIFSRHDYLVLCREKAASIPDVHFFDGPDTKTLVRFYNAADLFVTTAVSLFETFGRSPVEAMACGLPALAPEYDGFRDTITPSTGFLIPTSYRGIRKWPDVGRVADAILGALEDREGLAEKSSRAPRQARGFEKAVALTRFRDKLGEPEPAGDRQGPDVLCCDDLAPEIRALWPKLEGKPLRDLVTTLLSDWRPPVASPEEAVRGFFNLWFSHY